MPQRSNTLSKRQGGVPFDIYQSMSQRPPHLLHPLPPQADNLHCPLHPTWWMLITLTIPLEILHMLNHAKNPDSQQRYSAVQSTSLQSNLNPARFVITHSYPGLNFVINILQFSFRKRPWATLIVTSAKMTAYYIVARTVLDHLPAVVLVFSKPTATLHFTAFNTGMANFLNPQNSSIWDTFCILDMAAPNVLILAQQMRHSFVSLM